ncbi:hypothetical protein B9T23_16300 [Acinetobacter terrae]|uniref:hypothetical protein n=1 Tax=Acinetobacter terrae TaxID=2731247 RepID=UPI000A335E9F|nr:hypothetical protein [Acinetobacter terrae]OTG70483.1 hypothetical protein B9T23_16300 [Acinetobacter terrae]
MTSEKKKAPHPDVIKFNQRLTQQQRAANQSLCIWNGSDNDLCNNSIIKAHSIQRSKMETYIAEKGMVYTLKMQLSNDNPSDRPHSSFIKEGIGSFSVFKGFCGQHDKAIFAPIEDEAFTATEHQMTTYAYRSAAKELHTKLESNIKIQLNIDTAKAQLEAMGISDQPLPPHIQGTIPLMRSGIMDAPDYLMKAWLAQDNLDNLRFKAENDKLTTQELRAVCDHIQYSWEGIDTLALEHSYFSFDAEYPIVCCSTFIPYYDFEGKKIITSEQTVNLTQKLQDDFADFPNVFFNLFPEGDKTHVIFSYFKNNQAFKDSVQKLLSYDDQKIKSLLSSFLINYVENAAYKISYIEQAFSESERQAITDIFISNIFTIGSYKLMPINLFKDITIQDDIAEIES